MITLLLALAMQVAEPQTAPQPTPQAAPQTAPQTAPQATPQPTAQPTPQAGEEFTKAFFFGRKFADMKDYPSAFDQFKKAGTQVIVYPKELASGSLQFPYAEGTR